MVLLPVLSTVPRVVAVAWAGRASSRARGVASRENDATSRAFVVLAKDKTKCENNITGSNLATAGPKLLLSVPIAQASTQVIDGTKQFKTL
ncbi:hypothetical protein [Cyanobium sp. LEGE 06113]|uniref:hypothetical protein n=1 Tax=Cyanobium sp. LEGE 06113 TaxID=1297573 RepID=UPI001D14C14E|nr:hypothetical protein [Cyanobium sp. LEGE 06113]